MPRTCSRSSTSSGLAVAIHYGNTAFGQSLRNFRSGLPIPKVEIDESKVRRTSFRKRHRTHTAGGPSDYFMTAERTFSSSSIPSSGSSSTISTRNAT
jgi:hypothetical protein